MGTSHPRKGWPHPIIDLFINPCYHFLCLSAHISFVLEKKSPGLRFGYPATGWRPFGVFMIDYIPMLCGFLISQRALIVHISCYTY